MSELEDLAEYEKLINKAAESSNQGARSILLYEQCLKDLVKYFKEIIKLQQKPILKEYKDAFNATYLLEKHEKLIEEMKISCNVARESIKEYEKDLIEYGGKDNERD